MQVSSRAGTPTATRAATRAGRVQKKTFSFGQPQGNPPNQTVPAPSPTPVRAAAVRQTPRHTRRALPAFERARLRAKVATVTCSEPWTETITPQAEQHGIDPGCTSIADQLADRGIYPPRPELGPNRLPRRGAVRMRRCDACGRTVPPINLASYRLIRLCDDCRIEPEIDPDIAADRPEARAPGAHLCTLMERHDTPDKRELAKEKLKQLGLSDQHIFALAMAHAGYSTRSIADLGRWSQTYVRKLLGAAASKLRRSGLAVPQSPTAELSRVRIVDPAKLTAMSNRVV